jgi:hypothetical protein
MSLLSPGVRFMAAGEGFSLVEHEIPCGVWHAFWMDMATAARISECEGLAPR